MRSIALFFNLPGKLGNGAQLLKRALIIIGSNDAEFRHPLKYLTTYDRQRDLTLDAFFSNSRVLKMIIFVNVDFDIHLQDHLLQE